MKVLFHSRRNSRTTPGGDTVQMLRLREQLQTVGIEVDVHGQPEQVEDYDLVHFFNIMHLEDIYPQFAACLRLGIKMVITPWYLPMTTWPHYAGVNFRQRWCQGQPQRQQILQGVDMVLPGAVGEAVELSRDFGAIAPWRVLPVGTDIHLLRPAAIDLPEKTVLCVSRLCPRKNQLSLARVCRRLGLNLVLAGPVSDFGYSIQVREAYPQVNITGSVGWEQVCGLLQAAALHVLPSWYEAPGLGNLDAAAQGCNQVCTSEGAVREYLGERTVYSDPDNEDSLASLIETHIGQDPDPELATQVQKWYGWPQAAEILVEIYRNILQ